jgi:hypothetical protein
MIIKIKIFKLFIFKLNFKIFEENCGLKLLNF